MNCTGNIKNLVEKSKRAQEIIAEYSQERIDEIVKMFAHVVNKNAESLAKMAATETMMGVYEHKVTKNKGKSSILWNDLKGKKSVGILEHDREKGIVTLAKPIGVVGAVTPCTNPIVTPMCNAMFAIKGGNSIIIAPHPRAKGCAKAMAELYYEKLDEMRVPRDIFLVIEEPSIELTNELMRQVDIVIATGGAGMVKAAYSSGKPSFGVGPGNVQGIVDRDVSFSEVASNMIASRVFDNGIICSGTQTIIVHEDDHEKLMREFEAQGAYYISDEATIEKFRTTLFPDGKTINKDTVGQPIADVAKLARVELPKDTKVVLLKSDKCGKADVLSKEKMCAVMSTYTYKTWEEAVSIAYENLMYEGAGHSVDIQSNNRGHIEYAGLKLPVSRTLVNQICTSMNGGSFKNSLSPTTTLGCGSWGNNSISENLSYFHLFNKCRIAYVKENWSEPTQEELWN